MRSPIGPPRKNLVRSGLPLRLPEKTPVRSSPIRSPWRLVLGPLNPVDHLFRTCFHWFFVLTSDLEPSGGTILEPSGGTILVPPTESTDDVQDTRETGVVQHVPRIGQGCGSSVVSTTGPLMSPHPLTNRPSSQPVWDFYFTFCRQQK